MILSLCSGLTREKMISSFVFITFESLVSEKVSNSVPVIILALIDEIERLTDGRQKLSDAWQVEHTERVRLEERVKMAANEIADLKEHRHDYCAD